VVPAAVVSSSDRDPGRLVGMILFTVTFGFTLAGLNIEAVFASAFQKARPGKPAWLPDDDL
jgi:hypothetical protein